MHKKLLLLVEVVCFRSLVVAVNGNGEGVMIVVVDAMSEVDDEVVMVMVVNDDEVAGAVMIVNGE